MSLTRLLVFTAHRETDEEMRRVYLPVNEVVAETMGDVYPCGARYDMTLLLVTEDYFDLSPQFGDIVWVRAHEKYYFVVWVDVGFEPGIRIRNRVYT